jgi:uncharacterized protein (TIGR03086 family)
VVATTGYCGTEILPGGVVIRWHRGAMASPLPELLSDLSGLVGRLPDDRPDAPTPCPDFDVAALRAHVLTWMPIFAAALNDPDGAAPRPDPSAQPAPADAGEAASQLADVAKQVTAALDDGVADRTVVLTGDAPLPGSMVLAMLAAEVIVHGWDLSRATGLEWDPSPAACESALAGLRGMLLPDYRGPGRSFGEEVAVPEGARPLDRLVGFAGRDPQWSPSAPE